MYIYQSDMSLFLQAAGASPIRGDSECKTRAWGGGGGGEGAERGHTPGMGLPGEAHFAPRRQQIVPRVLRVPETGLEVLVQVHVHPCWGVLEGDAARVVLHERHLPCRAVCASRGGGKPSENEEGQGGGEGRAALVGLGGGSGGLSSNRGRNTVWRGGGET